MLTTTFFFMKLDRLDTTSENQIHYVSNEMVQSNSRKSNAKIDSCQSARRNTARISFSLKSNPLKRTLVVQNYYEKKQTPNTNGQTYNTSHLR
jgi:hypothetical protein